MADDSLRNIYKFIQCMGLIDTIPDIKKVRINIAKFTVLYNICYEILNSNEFRNIKDNLFERVDDDNQRASIKNKFEVKIKEFANFTNQSIIDQVKKNMRGALIEYKTGQYKYFVEHPKKR